MQTELKIDSITIPTNRKPEIIASGKLGSVKEAIFPELTIDREFSTLLPSHTATEIEFLEKSLIKWGCNNPICIWDTGMEKIILDGHARYRICKKHKIPFQVYSVPNILDKNDAVIWIFKSQLGRKNLTGCQVAILADELREKQEKLNEAETAKNLPTD